MGTINRKGSFRPSPFRAHPGQTPASTLSARTVLAQRTPRDVLCCKDPARKTTISSSHRVTPQIPNQHRSIPPPIPFLHTSLPCKVRGVSRHTKSGERTLRVPAAGRAACKRPASPSNPISSVSPVIFRTVSSAWGWGSSCASRGAWQLPQQPGSEPCLATVTRHPQQPHPVA